ncbi:MAG: hypothetical protein ACXVCM_24445, partial [Ktedonobacteraceae bacterium]
MLLDQGGTLATSLVEQAKQGRHRVGPLQESTRGPGTSRRRLWTVRLCSGLAAVERMLSSIGHLSQWWAPFLERHGTDKITVRFPAKTCQECVARTHSTTGARVTHSQAPASGKHMRRWRAPHSSKHMRSVLVSKGRC